MFGYTRERREERALIKWYRGLVSDLIRDYQANDYGLALGLARLPEMVRGYGPVKAENIEKMRAQEAVLLEQMKSNGIKAADAA